MVSGHFDGDELIANHPLPFASPSLQILIGTNVHAFAFTIPGTGFRAGCKAEVMYQIFLLVSQFDHCRRTFAVVCLVIKKKGGINGRDLCTSFESSRRRAEMLSSLNLIPFE